MIFKQQRKLDSLCSGFLGTLELEKVRASPEFVLEEPEDIGEIVRESEI